MVLCCWGAALELVAPVPAAADPDDDAAEWQRRALDAEEQHVSLHADWVEATDRITAALRVLSRAHPTSDCSDTCYVHQTIRALRGQP
jgi:hypothetical protein